MLLAPLLGVALSCAASADTPSRSACMSAPVLRLLTVAVEPGGTPAAAFDRALFGEVAREAGLDLAWSEVPHSDALAGLDAGRYDIAAGPFTPAEAAGQRWLAPVAPGGDAVLKRRGDGAILTAADLAGKATGVGGSPADVARLMRLTARLRARAVARPAWRAGAMPEDLLAGRLAAVAGPLDGLAATAAARPDLFEVVVADPSLRRGPVLRRGPQSDALAGAMTAALARMAADGRLGALQRRWFGIALAVSRPVP